MVEKGLTWLLQSIQSLLVLQVKAGVTILNHYPYLEDGEMFEKCLEALRGDIHSSTIP